jgi:hypothetical protein
VIVCALLSLIALATVGPLVAIWLLRGLRAAWACLAWWWGGCREDAVYPCPVCGYDIRETPHRCPECGTKLMWGILPGRKDLRRRRRRARKSRLHLG